MKGFVFKMVSITSVLIAMVLCEPAIQTAWAFSEENSEETTVSEENTGASEKDITSSEKENTEASKMEVSFQPAYGPGLKRTLPFTEAENITGYITIKGLEAGCSLKGCASVYSAEDMAIKRKCPFTIDYATSFAASSMCLVVKFPVSLKSGDYILKIDVEDITQKATQEYLWPFELLPKTEFRLLDICFADTHGGALNPYYIEGDPVCVRMNIVDTDVDVTTYVQQGDNPTIKLREVPSIAFGKNVLEHSFIPKGKYTMIVEAKNNTTGQEITYRLPFIVHEIFEE